MDGQVVHQDKACSLVHSIHIVELRYIRLILALVPIGYHEYAHKAVLDT